jgi:hypothetical protein
LIFGNQNSFKAIFGRANCSVPKAGDEMTRNSCFAYYNLIAHVLQQDLEMLGIETVG